MQLHANEKKEHNEVCYFKPYADFIIGAIEFEIGVLQHRISNTNPSMQPNLPKQGVKPEYKWTASKSDLIEVIESIILLGGINHGNINKDNLYTFIGKMLGTDLSNHSRILSHITSERKDYIDKKDSRVHYLKKLTAALSQKMEELDNEKANR